MGSLESGGVSFKRDSNNLIRSHSAGRTERNPFLYRPRSRLSRFLLFKKLDYIQWICTVAVFLFFVVLFQMFLPGSVVEKSELGFSPWRGVELINKDLLYLKEVGGLDFGEGIKFEPLKLLQKFQKENREMNMSFTNGTLSRFPYRKPQLALVLADLLVDPQQLLMVTVATALQEIGYIIHVYTLRDGPVQNIWKSMGFPVTIIQISHKLEIAVDWLNYDGILVNSLETRSVISCFMQEPFKSVPLIWTIHERALAIRSRQYTSSWQIELLNDWRKAFNRATVVVFPNHVLPMMYSAFDTGNYYVIPGSPAEVWEADTAKALYNDDIRAKMGYEPTDIVVAVVGSQFLYRGLWLEQALVLKALLPLLQDFPLDSNSNSHLKIIVLRGDSTGNYSAAVEAIAVNLSYPRGTVKYFAVDSDVSSALSAVDLVVYGSFLEEQSFPEILVKAMSIGKPIIAPDLSMIGKYVDDKVNGYLFPKENLKVLTQIVLQVISKGTLSPLAHNIASIGKSTAKNLMVLETIEGYATLLENALNLPSEVALPKSVQEIPPKLKKEWCWNLFKAFLNSTHEDIALKSSKYLNKVEEQWNHEQRESSGLIAATDDSFSYDIWKEEKNTLMLNTRKRREEEELKDRTDQPRGTWEEVYRSAKRADRSRNDLHERDEGELLRTGQPLCIYEPYFGEGTWSFLHLSSLYRGIGLSTKGRRPGTDDIDAPSRLSLLSSSYYRDALGDYGAFFAIANQIDRIHKNSWIGFQSWRATARKASLSRIAEKALVDAIETQKHRDSLYFWVPMDTDPRSHLRRDFWSFCDAINAGNCKLAFSEAFKRMYGIKHDLDSLPSMPEDGDTWSVMLSFALPTRSFLEFVMFSRMFVDALDAHMYDEHHRSGRCYLSPAKDKHCYSRVLELLINVWAYHSARQMVYVNPETGLMKEQHVVKSRRGKMWARWFSYSILKSMDEDLAEEADSDRSRGRWLWPSTGEVVWEGVFEKERNLKNHQKEKRRQQSRDKQQRMRKKHRQKVLGKYVKPPPEDTENSNSTMSASETL
ncbi:GLYCOSYL TRANSFERASE FAMILY 1 PROTEIN [Salix purpurea]|uniref:GLYCOSYL TRANSFERASE FAMILY 1 PROTEIN n=1 Tax=Salix purpurea TaxID=77065 RepID=A0A9Q0SQY8_SALPP|nr:GLYCOSYL TRANSFERASE FAMILY 1 PROTEIN [Salix purpurea]